jgi:uncharacterized protein YdhG (YjbR/CyaY superfamily)
MTAPATVDEYLAALPARQRAALAEVRAQLAGLLPDATEEISYGIPTFKCGGRAVVWYAAWKAHCTIYPLTDVFLAAHAGELAGFRRTKGSVHFTPEAPLPATLIAALVRARLDDLGLS